MSAPPIALACIIAILAASGGTGIQGPAAPAAVPSLVPVSAQPRAAAPARAPIVASKAPPGPPDGTYVYAIARNGTDQGKTTITIFRRDDTSEVETNESGYAGAARAQIVASYRYADLAPDSYVGTYRAPFLKASAFGALLGARAALAGAGEPVTVRYRVDGLHAKATIDGVIRSRDWQPPRAAPQPQGQQTQSQQPQQPQQPQSLAAKTRWILDGPFMTGALLAPVYRHRSGDAVLAPISAAFDEGVELAPERIVDAAPHFPKTPKADVALELGGVATIWFNRGNYIVDEVHFDGLNLDAHLVSYSRAPIAAVLAPEDAATPRARLASRALVFASQDGTQIPGILDLPSSGKPRAPALIFVPPGPEATLNFQNDGPDPMYPNLALAFAARGYAIVRYNGRESVRNAAGSTWEQAIADLEGALAAASDDDAIDPKRMYVLGYGTGADLALAVAGGSDAHIAGVVALGPSVIGYRDCAQRSHASESGSFFKSASAHDPAILAQRSRVPAFVLHSGASACGETHDETAAYDDKLRAANPLATIVVASDLSTHFGGLYDADAPLDTEEFFPYHFDASTRDAIGEWLDNPKAAAPVGSGVGTSNRPRPPAPPPPPKVTDTDMNGEMPNPHVAGTPRSIEPGVVLPSGMTPPPYQPEPPVATPTPALTPAPPAPATATPATAAPSTTFFTPAPTPAPTS